MRLRSPCAVTRESSQQSSVCSCTSDWRNRMQRSGSRPAAMQHRGRVEHVLAQLAPGRTATRDRVQVDDAVDRLAAVLALDVLADRADVVAEVLAAGGLDAAEDAHGGAPARRSSARGWRTTGPPRGAALVEPPHRRRRRARSARSPGPPRPRPGSTRTTSAKWSSVSLVSVSVGSIISASSTSSGK